METIGPVREKYWSEKTDQEKIFSLGEAVDTLSKKVIELETSLMGIVQHSHNRQGVMMIPLRYVKYEPPYYLRNLLRREDK